ncbi:pyruvate dehydrogenase E2 component (dihydrolipoamide acetyltransferase) [Fodinibius sediminis]|uniref:Dihydrolipoamide acetyltransferase component of pyruvate dehydrogenase complex n=2 Tax=Fodinibius sediminis TaxID=1214077 RepID=A0A521BE74_9BACT|nr:pyruvate dehydrogenase E2 component (dihydrolipoamide acetyltransferase) [Fodinibius sediminis]
MPSLGSQMIEARLIQWLVKPGDTVKRGDIIGEIDTEKGLIDIEVFEDGVVTELVSEEGEVIPVGSVMAVIDGEDEGEKAKAKLASPPEEPEKKEPRKKREKAATPPEQPETASREVPLHRVKASPLARRVAEDLQVDLSKVKGSGAEGTIHKKDVEAFAKQKAADETFEKELDMAEHLSAAGTGGMRQAIAAAMSRSNREIPHYYLETEIDMKVPLDWLNEQNKERAVSDRLLPPMLLIKAVANVLTELPALNGFWTDEAMHVEEGIHIGFAIALRQGGLVIPAILNADLKSLEETRSAFVDMVMRAREGHLRSREISSATITVTSLGERGADKVYGVIYPPQVALVGFGKIAKRPQTVDGAIGIRPTLSVVLAGDHRASDGHTGSRFLEKLNEQLQHPEAL